MINGACVSDFNVNQIRKNSKLSWMFTLLIGAAAMLDSGSGLVGLGRFGEVSPPAALWGC